MPAFGQVPDCSKSDVVIGGTKQPEHYLDYFHASLQISPDQSWVADYGWVWQPVGLLRTWNLRRWIEENSWESEDGPSVRDLTWCGYFWDGPVCWLDSRNLAVWGYGREDEWLIPAVVVFNVEDGKQVRWFPGPQKNILFDEYLFSWSTENGMSVWDIESSERLTEEPTLCPCGYHRGDRNFLSVAPDGSLKISSLNLGGKP